MTSRPRGLIGFSLALFVLIMPFLAQAASVQLDESSYTSPHYDYVVSWDDAWAPRERETVSSGEVDTLVLTNNAGRLVIEGREGGTADEALGETVEQMAREPEVIAEDHEAEVPSVEFTSGRNHYLVQAYALDGSVVVVALRAREDDYATALAAAQSGVTLYDTPVLSGEPVESPEPAATPEPSAEASPEAPQASPVPTGETGLDGNTFTSPRFGLTLQIPADWTVENELIAVGDEILALSNGTSLVTVHPTSLYTGELDGCVGYARSLIENDPTYEDLRLSTTSAGDPFEGVDDRNAYALYQYTGADGTTMAYFVHCQAIVEGESVLIVTQQVPYEEYIAERSARRQIQNAIDLP